MSNALEWFKPSIQIGGGTIYNPRSADGIDFIGVSEDELAELASLRFGYTIQYGKSKLVITKYQKTGRRGTIVDILSLQGDQVIRVFRNYHHRGW